ncbi:hypothetical protein [Peribacillus frigoritolerans]|uniref:Uncharacterized protein n=1 Tax=Peribacillus castrilensis TaxID=2897690 RepID=A0AAW9NLU0_9BACI|nr:hypothetical protein [Peribacillus castrilensis]
MAKKMIIKGVGTFMAKRAKKDGKGLEVVTLGTLQDLKIDLNVELEDIFGGDGLFAIDTLVKSKSIEITATDAKFDLAALELMMGSRVVEQQANYVWVLNEQGTAVTGTAGAEYEPVFGGAAASNTIFGDGNFSVRLKDDNSLFTKVTGTPAKDNEFKYDSATGKLVFSAAISGQDIAINYQREETVDLVDILSEEVPVPVHIIHHGSFLQKDGTYGGIETELYQARAKGTFSIDAQRAAASASAIQLQVLDPERPDGKLGSIKRYSSATKV